MRRSPAYITLWIWAGCFIMLGCVGSVIPTGGLGSEGLSSFTMPRWICPSPTPLPTREKPPEDGIGDGAATPTPQFYQEWEQEYGLPLMTPTPYVKEGTTFFIGQFVEVAQDVYAQVQIEQQPTADGMMLYMLRVEITNRTTGTLSINPVRQIILNVIQTPDGRKVAGNWTWTREASLAANMDADNEAVLIAEIDQGTHTIQLPILAPPQEIGVLDLQLDGLHAGSMRIQFVRGSVSDCDSAGVQSDGLADIGQPIVAPPGTDGIVASALQQVGRQYCWGGKGYIPCSGCSPGAGCVTPPCASLPCFDCSGLTWWAYHDNGITIGHGTANQQLYQEISLSQIASGDLALFTTINSHSRAGITHVGLIGDVNQDGKWDLIHSANYPDGVVVSYAFLESAYYRNNLILVTRPARNS